MSESFDLTRDPVEYLIRHAGWDDVLTALRDIEQWTDDIARKLDVYFLHHTIRLLRVSTIHETLLDFAEHLARAAHPRRSETLNGLDKCYADRWLAWRDLVDARAEAMSAPVENAVKNRTHLMTVLKLLADNGDSMPQSEIGKALHINSPNLTRVMNMLEGAEMIERSKEGREKIVRLTAAGRALVVVQPVADQQSQKTRSGINLWSKAA